MGVTALACPSCGGALAVADGARLVTCRYCGGRSLALVPGALPRLVVAEQISADQARRRAVEILADAPIPAAVRARPGVADLTLCFVPFYEYTAVRLGAFRLTAPPEEEEGANHGGDGVATLRLTLRGKAAEDSRVIEQAMTRIVPACDLAALGLEHIPLERMRQEARALAIQPYDPMALQRKATVFAPTRDAAQYLAQMQTRAPLATDRTRVVEPRLIILFYPVWLIRYRYGGRLYEIALDGVTGLVLRGRAPVAVPYAALLSVAVMMLAAFLAGRPTHALLAAAGPGHWLLDLITIGLGAALGGALAFMGAVITSSICSPAGDLCLEQGGEGSRLEIAEGLGSLASIGATVALWLLERSGGERRA